NGYPGERESPCSRILCFQRGSGLECKNNKRKNAQNRRNGSVRRKMTEAVIVSGGNIQKDFALDFLRKNKNKDYYMIAADRGLEFFMETGLVPDAAVGDFDSLSPEGLAYLESLENTEICRLQPEKDDSD